MLNSIVVTHRNRPDSLKVFLQSIEIASKYVRPDSYEVVLTDLGSKDSCIRLIESYSSRINLRLFKIPYKDVFWKTKALNFSVKQSIGDYITMIDIDSIVPPLFLKGIEDFYSIPENFNIKLAHRVRFVDDKTTTFLKNNDLNETYLKKNIIAYHGFFKLAKERFGIQEGEAKTEEDYLKNALGNSHFTAKKEFYMEIGGCDERFKGRSCEDMDFNLRLFKHMKNGRLRKSPELTVYHILHMHEKDWNDKDFVEKNRKLYIENKEKNIIILPIGKDWGEFNI